MKIEIKNLYTKENPLEIFSIEEAKLQSYSQKIYVKFICEDCGKISQKLAISVVNTKSLTCSGCARKRTYIERFGVDNPAKLQSSKDKVIKTCQDKYGTDSPLQNTEVKDKIVKTNLERRGVACSLQDPKVRALGSKTKLKIYGDANYNNPKKASETNLDRFGTTSPSKNLEIKERGIETSIKLYGNRCPLMNVDIRNKANFTMRKNYGENILNVFQAEPIKAQCRATLKEKTGYEYTMQDPATRKKARRSSGQSFPEKKTSELLISEGFIFESEYYVNGKCFDFAIFNKEGTLNTLIEIDGEYFHGLLNDYDGYHVHGEKDCERFEKVPEGVKFIVCDSKHIEKAFSLLCENFEISYENWIQTIIDSCNSISFPYPTYEPKRLLDDWKKLCGNVTYNKNSHVGQSIISNYHKSIFTSRVGNFPTPVEAWNNPELLAKNIRNRFIYSNELSTQKIADGFNVSRISPKVSVFRAILAKHLISKYLSNSKEVFDPFSGFSGRMLGTCSLNKRYIGQDINAEHITESNGIISFLNLDARVEQKSLVESTGNYETLFTSPPYNLTETWSNDNQKNFSCDEWIDECLKRFKCEKYLFVVDNTEKYKGNIVEELPLRSNFGDRIEYVILLS